MANETSEDEWRTAGRVPVDELDVERMRWDNQPDGFIFKVGFKRPRTEEERGPRTGKETTVDREEYDLRTLLRQHPDDTIDHVIRSRSDVTNDVVRAALEHALYLYCEARFDPDDVCVHNIEVEERRKLREAEAPSSNRYGVGQPHSDGPLPDWADE